MRRFVRISRGALSEAGFVPTSVSVSAVNGGAAAIQFSSSELDIEVVWERGHIAAWVRRDVRGKRKLVKMTDVHRVSELGSRTDPLRVAGMARLLRAVARDLPKIIADLP